MNETSATAMLVGTRDMFAADSGAVTTTLPREEIEAALTSEPPADLILEILRAAPGNHDPENRTVNVGWARSDLESLLRDPGAEAITFSFDPAELERAFDEPDVEGHGLREAAVVLSIAAAAAVGASSSAFAQPDPAGAQVQVSVSGHDEAGLTARGIEIQPAAAVHDEATLTTRGIERGTFAVAQHDEASSTARGIGIQPAAPAHDEALTARELGTPAVSHDEASLTARGIETGTLAAVHDEASLTARGIEPGTPAASRSQLRTTRQPLQRAVSRRSRCQPCTTRQLSSRAASSPSRSWPETPDPGSSCRRSIPPAPQESPVDLQAQGCSLRPRRSQLDGASQVTSKSASRGRSARPAPRLLNSWRAQHPRALALGVESA